MTAVISIAKLADLKALLPVRAGSTDFDDRMRSVLRTATLQIEKACRLKLSQNSYVETFDAPKNLSLIPDFFGNSNSGAFIAPDMVPFKLKGINIDAETLDVRFDPYRLFGDDTKLSSDCYSLDGDDNRTLRVYSGLYQTRASVRVAYSAGFAAVPENDANEEWLTMADAMTGVADEFIQACILQALHLWNRATVDNIGVAAEDANKGKTPLPYTVAGGLIPEAWSMIFSHFRAVIR